MNPNPLATALSVPDRGPRSSRPSRPVGRILVANVLILLWAGLVSGPRPATAADAVVGGPGQGAVLVPASGSNPAGEPNAVEVKNASIDGRIDGDKARLVIEATLGGLPGVREDTLYGAGIEQVVQVARDRVTQEITARVEAVRGGLREVVFQLGGSGTPSSVEGEGLLDWSVRRLPEGGRQLVLRLKPAEKPVTTFVARIKSETRLGTLPGESAALTLTTEPAALTHGYLRLEPAPELEVQLRQPTGVVPIELGFLPAALRPAEGASTAGWQAFRFHGGGYTLPFAVGVADPEARQPVVSESRLVGQLAEDGSSAAFTLTATVRVRNPKGGEIEVLSGGVALGESPGLGDGAARLRFDQGRFLAVFDRAGEFPLRVKFQAAVRPTNGWSVVDFRVAAGSLAPVRIEGLAAGTQLRFEEAARPERAGDAFASHLPPGGRVSLAWRVAASEAEGRLFYAAEAVTQVAVAPGLLRQITLFDLKVMQGELTRVAIRLRGEGEVTRVQGPQVLAWEVEAGTGPDDRRLVVQFNQPQRDQATFQLQLQRSLAAFPLAVEAVRLEPEGATRFGGFVRVVNEGAVRLEVVESTGLSQISPEQFVQTEATKALLPAAASQVFAFRSSGPATTLRIQADNILPELAVSAVVTYHLGETELAIDGEFEVDVREAPLRELLLRVPRGYSLARLEAAGSSDHFLTAGAEGTNSLLRLVYGAPVMGRQVVQLRLERNTPLADNRWVLSRLDVVQARSVRGHVGVTADAGYRVTPGQTAGLTELAPAFFPRKLAGLQSAFRIAEPAWQATLNVERVAQSVQADAFHLFSVGEGIAYGSSLINYLVSGAPVSALQVELSAEYFNVEFTGKNVRNWQKTDRGFTVHLHTPVAGTYTLLATYERPFKAQGETLEFTGVRPLDAQSEQGYTLVISTFQFQVQAASVTGSLAPIEPAEVPAEYRLFFDAPILAAYRYTARPFNLRLELRPLAQFEAVGQVVDRAALTTRISEEGQVVTEARYFVKNKGAPNILLRLPDGAELWSVTVDGATVVPVKDQRGNLIPLPHRGDPNVVSELRVKVASKAGRARRLSVAAPVVSAPVLLAEWRLTPSDSRRLVYRGGTLTPAEGVVDVSGFAGLGRLLHGDARFRVVSGLCVLFGALLVGGLVWSGFPASHARRFGLRHLAAGLVGFVAAGLALVTLLQLRELAAGAGVTPAPDLRFVAPVQQGDAAWRVDIENLPRDAASFGFSAVFLGLLALAVWLYTWLTSRAWFRTLGGALGWTLLGWAALRSANGAQVFFLVLLAFAVVQVLLPAGRRWWRGGEGQGHAGNAGEGGPTANPAGVLSTVIATLGFGLGLGFGSGPAGEARGATPASTPLPAVASVQAAPVPAAGGPATTRSHRGPDSVEHEIRVEDEYVFGTARIRWDATAGQVLPLLHEPGVLTRSGHATNAARLVQVMQGGKPVQVLVAEATGWLEFALDYQTRVVNAGGGKGFLLPVEPGLVNRARLTLRGLDVDVSSPQAVAVRRESAIDATNTVASLVLGPSAQTWIAWKPRSRDTRREKAVFYAEFVQVYVPGPGVVEGWHEAVVRPARGELDALVFEVPAGATITDVASPALSFWRFDPDTRRLRVTLTPAQSRPFVVRVKSQFAATPLPFERAAGLLAVEGAAGQIGLAGVATGSEVQLDDVTATGFSPINLEDFPGAAVQAFGAQVPGLTVRRAFRYSASTGTLTVKASPVEADVRVESQQTLSLGEDRTVLAANLAVEVMRAGIFKLSFRLPAGLEIDAITGPALSHWTELKTGDDRVVTLHLKGKTEGRQAFAVTLAGPGIRSTKGWAVPRLSLREAAKQRGQLLVVPEQGLRLQVATREGATQLDPVQAGIRQKGVLAFRLLQDPWTLTLDLDRVDAWVQVTGLQHVVFGEAQVRVSVNLQYEIENTGVKSLVVRLPATADNVRFRGEQVTDFLPRTGGTNAAAKDWEIKLERRVIGKYLLHAEYTLPLAEQATAAEIEGVVAQEVNLQRGFVTVQAGGRLQVRLEPPAALQATEWQVVPRALLQDIAMPSAEYAFRLVDPAFRLPVRLERREAARLLPARVNRVTLTSVVSDDGAVLTQVRMELVPGDKRLLPLTLPRQARFWFAFVNQNSVWPWQSTNQVLVPLEQSSRTGEAAVVEFFYSSVAGAAGRRSLDLDLLAPKFDLPLENIEWIVYLNEKWRLRDWSGSMQLRDDGGGVVPAAALDLDSYVRNEAQIRQEKTKEAGQFLDLANNLLQQGDPQQARRAFQAAYGMSQHDQAFNEDARVQLNNLKLQQALVGLNVRQVRVAGDAAAPGAAPRGVWDNSGVNYSQVEAKQLLERNTTEDNAVQQRLAERLIQQQDAALAAPAAIRATVPEQGRRIVFTRPLEVNTWTELRVGIEADATGAVSGFGRLLWLALAFVALALLAASVRRRA